MFKTPDLSGFQGAFPKPAPRVKKSPKPLKAGKKVTAWTEGRQDLKVTFKENGITTCEIYPYLLENQSDLLKQYPFDKCKHKNFLGFAHIRRRNNLTEKEIVDPHFVVLADQNCHEIVDQKMPKGEAEELLDAVVKARGW